MAESQVKEDPIISPAFHPLAIGDKGDAHASPEQISASGLPYPNLPIYTQSLQDTKTGVDLEDLIDGMNHSEEWGEQNLDLEGYTDTAWLEIFYEAFREDGVDEMFISIDPTPVEGRKMWREYMGAKQRRMGRKHSKEVYATRFRRHGSGDQRGKYVPGL